MRKFLGLVSVQPRGLGFCVRRSAFLSLGATQALREFRRSQYSSRATPASPSHQSQSGGGRLPGCREAAVVFASLAGGALIGWKLHYNLTDYVNAQRAAVAVVRLIEASPALAVRETADGQTQVCIPSQVEEWRRFLHSQPGFVSLQIFVKDEIRASDAEYTEGEARSCELMLLERWETPESIKLAEENARQEKNSQRGYFLKCVEWPSRVYRADSQATASLIHSLGFLNFKLEDAGQTEALESPPPSASQTLSSEAKV